MKISGYFAVRISADEETEVVGFGVVRRGERCVGSRDLELRLLDLHTPDPLAPCFGVDVYVGACSRGAESEEAAGGGDGLLGYECVGGEILGVQGFSAFIFPVPLVCE